MHRCANHGERGAATRCVRGRGASWGPSCAFVGNGGAWCEPCGRQMVEYGRGSKMLAAIVLAAGTIGLYLLFDTLHFGLFSSRKVAGLVVLGLIVAGIAYRI